jgi:hypothetical protein
MILRIFPLMLLALGLLLAWPTTEAHAQAHGEGRDTLFQYDANHPAYRDIQREESLGRQHVEGEVPYGTEYPTSGPHNPSPIPPGFYNDELPAERLVHSMEHGNIIIYYDEPSDAAMKLIRGWTDQFGGVWDGVIAVHKEGLGERIVMTAWQHRLELDKMDARAAFFLDGFRGRGPENRVR